MIAFYLLLLCARGIDNPFAGLDKIPVLRGYEDAKGVPRPHLYVPRDAATVLANQVFRDSAGREVYIEAYRFRPKEDIAPAIKQSLRRQAATMPIDLPELKKDGFKISFVGNPLVLECDIVTGKVWARVQLHRKGEWHHGGVDQAKIAGEQVRMDGVTIPFLRGFLPEIRKRAEEANRHPTASSE
ncbi:MAG: hypothetical protein ACHQ50_01165 [Fimbriimonadales bacterium]